MGFFDNMFKGIKHYPDSVRKRVILSAESLSRIVIESIASASNSNDIDTKKSRLDYAMKKLVELIKLANEYPFLDFRKISSIYDSIREIRNEIKEMESSQGQPQIQEPGSQQSNTTKKTKTAGQGAESAVCPYCSHILPIMPQRRTICPACNKTIYVWYSTKQNMKKLITEDEALKIEKEISENIERYEILNKHQTLDESEDEVINVQSKLKENDPNATLDDAYMFLLDKKIKDTDHDGEKARLYYLKALMLDNSGKEFFASLEESRKFELQHLKKHEFVKKVQIITSPDSCEACKTNSDTVISIDEALKEMPLPHKNCHRALYSERGFCRCSYLIVN